MPAAQSSEYLKGREFALRDGKVVCELGNGVVVELPVHVPEGGEINLEKWDEGLIRYIHFSLLALESPTTPFTTMPEYTDGRESFPIAQSWSGWGMEKKKDGKDIFTLLGSYH